VHKELHASTYVGLAAEALRPCLAPPLRLVLIIRVMEIAIGRGVEDAEERSTVGVRQILARAVEHVVIVDQDVSFLQHSGLIGVGSAAQREAEKSQRSRSP